MNNQNIQDNQSFWSIPTSEVLQQLQTTSKGLTGDEAENRLAKYGSNLLTPKKRSDSLALLLAQFKSPLIILLIFAGGLSFYLDVSSGSLPTNAIIIVTIILISSLLGFWQERGAANAVQKLLAIVQTKATVLRDGNQKDIPVETIVPGDVIILNAGDLVPGDSIVLESKDLFVNEASLTGETYPAEKTAGVLPPGTPLSQRTNSIFMGTNVVSGSAQAVVVETGSKTEFGKVSVRLKLRPPETEFEHGVRHFGYLLMEVTMVLVVITFAINVYFARSVLESLLFSLALAVGLTPQLLPAIISINLAQGAKIMATQKVIVKRLASIENFGSMNVLCSDKTGTLTEGVIKIQSVVDFNGNQSGKALLYAYLNASYQTGFTNPIDEAIRANKLDDLSGYQKLDEVPYDFVRKRLSVLVSKDNKNLMVTKGALQNVLDVCATVETSEGTTVQISGVQQQIQQRFEEFSSKGFRVLGIAYKDIGSEKIITKDSEVGMTFLGFLVLFDPSKPKIAETISDLKHLGISLKIVTGDNRLVAASVSQQIGFQTPKILAGSDLRALSDEALLKQVNEVDVFAEVEPNQKERIILALKKAGNVVGYMGDGINDASALHAADVGLSVESAVDVAKEAADIVLLEKDLGVLANGVKEGRKTFANTLKYVFMATSANFGNMFSMAGASLFLSFLPLLPGQILLTNLMTDLPETTIGTDNVDSEMVEHPRRWNVGFIRNFMIVFGILSSAFDYLAFGVLIFVFKSPTIPFSTFFRTGWFIESVISASLIVLVIRSRGPFFKSVPGKYLLITTLLIVGATVILPFTLLGRLFGFASVPLSVVIAMAAIVVLYLVSGEVVKRVFYKRVKF
ncbi:MAG: magnesium-translocating P-type ATPase [Candidatus Bathyarchaeia archaeon]